MAKFKKGQSGNPNGRPKGSKNAFTSSFEEALAMVEGKKKKSLLVYACEQAYVDNKVLVKILDKILPNLSKQEGVLDGSIQVIIKTDVPSPGK